MAYFSGYQPQVPQAQNVGLQNPNYLGVLQLLAAKQQAGDDNALRMKEMAMQQNNQQAALDMRQQELNAGRSQEDKRLGVQSALAMANLNMDAQKQQQDNAMTTQALNFKSQNMGAENYTKLLDLQNKQLEGETKKYNLIKAQNEFQADALAADPLASIDDQIKAYRRAGNTAAANQLVQANKLSSEGAKAVSLAQLGLNNIKDLGNLLSGDKAPKDWFDKQLFKYGSLLTPTATQSSEQQLYTLYTNSATQAFGRLVSGATITPVEEQQFLALMPRIDDDASARDKKIEQLNELYQNMLDDVKTGKRTFNADTASKYAPQQSNVGANIPVVNAAQAAATTAGAITNKYMKYVTGGQ